MLADSLASYLRMYPGERTRFKLLQKQISNNETLDDRRNFTGHVTGSAIILSPDHRRILLIHHKAYDAWQQPGGHWEKADKNPLAVARREGSEETGLNLDRYLPVDSRYPLVPFDIDSHAVPARPEKNEPPHHHHDFRYVFIADEAAIKHQVQEVIAAGWFTFEAPETERVQKIITKLKTAQLK